MPFVPYKRQRRRPVAAMLLAVAMFARPAFSAPVQPAPQVVQPARNEAKPAWAELSSAQRDALAPLSSEWSGMDALHKRKWLTVAARFATMTPDAQQRLHERMRDWIGLTPEQRRLARESYYRAKRLGPREKTEKWEQYRQLPEEQKRKLAEKAPAKRRVTRLPPAHAVPHPVPPIKATPSAGKPHGAPSSPAAPVLPAATVAAPAATPALPSASAPPVADSPVAAPAATTTPAAPQEK
ncbi:MAG: DUF3106 domain-containing protein [Burkholderiaceae bacterium]